MIKKIRENIGIIISCFGFFLLTILIFGDVTQIHTRGYWVEVYQNLVGYTLFSFAVTLLQVAIKQGIGEQALRTGINSPETITAITEHRKLIKGLKHKESYLPFFLEVYNERETKCRRNRFLYENLYKTEIELLDSKKKRIIKKYLRIRTAMRVSDLRWVTNEIKFDKFGRFETLTIHRKARLIFGLITAVVLSVFMLLISDKLFPNITAENIGQKIFKLFIYVVVIGFNEVFIDAPKEYEYGKYTIPVLLENINNIWLEFEQWKIPPELLDDLEQETPQCVSAWQDTPEIEHIDTVFAGEIETGEQYEIGVENEVKGGENEEEKETTIDE
jgi:hypothetical protein